MICNKLNDIDRIIKLYLGKYSEDPIKYWTNKYFKQFVINDIMRFHGRSISGFLIPMNKELWNNNFQDRIDMININSKIYQNEIFLEKYCTIYEELYSKIGSSVQDNKSSKILTVYMKRKSLAGFIK